MFLNKLYTNVVGLFFLNHSKHTHFPKMPLKYTRSNNTLHCLMLIQSKRGVYLFIGMPYPGFVWVRPANAL